MHRVSGALDFDHLVLWIKLLDSLLVPSLLGVVQRQTSPLPQSVCGMSKHREEATDSMVENP